MANQSERPFEQSGPIKFPITPRTLPKLIRFGWAIRRAQRTQDLDAEIPGTVIFDDQSTALLERARDLASDEREDPAAVRDLQAMAKGHGRELRLAALGTRQWNGYRESSVDNLAHRLLQAAISDTPVEPISVDDRERLEKIDAFAELPHDEQWRLLVQCEPRLAQVEADALAGQFRAHDVLALPQEERKEAAGENLRGMKRLADQLEPLVGLNSTSADVILTTHLAREVAGNQLLTIRKT
jgi:hypothetical protein